MKHREIAENAAVWREPKAIALLLAASLTTMANSTISPALPGLEREFSAVPDAPMLARLLVPAPSLAVALCAPLAGLAVDRFGRRGVLLAGIIVFTIAGSAGMFLPDLRSIFASRLMLGIAVAMIMTSQTALIGDYFTGGARSAMMGLQISARNFGGLVFISLAGCLAVTSPRLPFAIYGLAAVFLPLIWFSINEPVKVRQTTVHTMHAADRAHPHWVLLIAGLTVVQMLTSLIFFMMPTQLPFYFEAMGYESASTTGIALGVLTFTGGCVALQFGRLNRAIGASGTYALGFMLMAIGFALVSFGEHRPAILVGATAVGAGYALVAPNFVAIALAIAPAWRRGLAGGILTTSVFIGQFMSPFVSIPAISLFDYAKTFQGAALALAIMGVTALAMFMGSVITRPTRQKT